MMSSITLSIVIGYLLGSLSPAALFSKLKNKDLRSEGTGNLGATNTMLVLGKSYGVFVMLFDIAKSFTAVKLSQIFFGNIEAVGIISGSAAVVGHIYPFYLQFKGGKGLAAFGGLVLGLDPWLFSALLVIALVLMFIINYSVAVPMSAAVLFPIFYGIKTHDAVSVLIAAAVSILLISKNLINIGRARRGEDVKIREYVRNHLMR